ncbi:hypothetical protein PPACK8108_LOCUS12333, partial [Phakopsora pachyrhizi]
IQILKGNVNELGDVCKGPMESFLFSLTILNPGSKLFKDRVSLLVELYTSINSGASLRILEKLA